MLKPYQSRGSSQWMDGVQCFVATDELRRLLCLMAATELIQELTRELRPLSSAREVKLPPALL